MGHESAALKKMTVDEFLEWGGDGGDTRYELIEGTPMAMTPPRRAHGTIVVNLAAELRSRLPDGCVAVAEAGILSPTRADSLYQADLAITCEPPRPDHHAVPAPRLIIEVLSPSTEAHDRRVKLVDYRQIPTIEEIVLIDQERPFCEIHRKTESGQWLVELLVDRAASMNLESISATIPLEAIYANL